MKTEIEIKPTVNFTVHCELTERELRALDALVGYGFDSFIKCFYEHMGKTYLEPFERDLKQLFEKVVQLRPTVSKIGDARKLLGLQNS